MRGEKTQLFPSLRSSRPIPNHPRTPSYRQYWFSPFKNHTEFLYKDMARRRVGTTGRD